MKKHLLMSSAAVKIGALRVNDQSSHYLTAAEILET